MTIRSKKIFLIIALMTMCIGLVIYSSDLGKLRILVKDSKGNPLPDVTITIKDTQEVATPVIKITTKKSGIALHSGLKNHVFEITVEKQGYTSGRLNVKIPAGLLQDEEVTLSTTEESLQKAAANDPRSQAIDLFNKAAGFINEKKYDEALDALKKSKELDPSIYQTHFYTGVVLFEKGNFKEAIQPLLDAIELKNDEGGPFRLLAAIYEKLGNKEEMAKYTKLAQEKGGKTATDVFNDGIAAYNRNETDNALAAFQKTIEMDANFAEAYYYVGMCYLNKDMNDKAILNLKKYLELKPNGEEAESAKSIIDSLQ